MKPAQQCESFSNHGTVNPHNYCRSTDNVFVGDCVAEFTPQYRLDPIMQTYQDMTCICDVWPEGSSKRYFRYTVPVTGVPTNCHLRSSADCQEYPDIRTQYPDPERRETMGRIPDLSPVIMGSMPDITFFLSTEMDFGSNTIWEVGTPDGPVNGLTFRVDGGDWKGFVPAQFGFFFVKPQFHYSSTGTFVPNKDFILDISHDGGTSIQRFTVYRYFQGGHYSAISTMTRQDGRVFVTAELASAEVQQVLYDKNGPGIYPSNSVYGMCFDLGYQEDGDYFYTLKSYNGVVLDDYVHVKVLRTA